MRRVLTGGLVVGLLVGAALVIGAGVNKDKCPFQAGEGTCNIAKNACPTTVADCPKETEGVCCAVKDGVCPTGENVADCPKAAEQACPLTEGDCPKETDGVCCAVKEGVCPKGENVADCPKAAEKACPLTESDCPQSKAGEAKPAGCPMTAPAAGCAMTAPAASPGGCAMHAATESAGQKQAE